MADLPDTSTPPAEMPPSPAPSAPVDSPESLWLESNAFWGIISAALAVILLWITWVAKDMRWALIAAWPLVCLALKYPFPPSRGKRDKVTFYALAVSVGVMFLCLTWIVVPKQTPERFMQKLEGRSTESHKTENPPISEREEVDGRSAAQGLAVSLQTLAHEIVSYEFQRQSNWLSRQMRHGDYSLVSSAKLKQLTDADDQYWRALDSQFNTTFGPRLNELGGELAKRKIDTQPMWSAYQNNNHFTVGFLLERAAGTIRGAAFSVSSDGRRVFAKELAWAKSSDQHSEPRMSIHSTKNRDSRVLARNLFEAAKKAEWSIDRIEDLPSGYSEAGVHLYGSNDGNMGNFSRLFQALAIPCVSTDAVVHNNAFAVDIFIGPLFVK